jgi:hypothetical protein
MNAEHLPSYLSMTYQYEMQFYLLEKVNRPLFDFKQVLGHLISTETAISPILIETHIQVPPQIFVVIMITATDIMVLGTGRSFTTFTRITHHWCKVVIDNPFF